MISRALHLHQAGSRDQIGQAGEAVIAGIEIRSLFGQMRADPGQVGARPFPLLPACGLFVRRGRRFGFRRGAIEHVEINELVASLMKGRGVLRSQKP